MEIYYQLFYINSALLVLMIIFKTYHFLSKSSYHSFANWIRFDRNAIYNSHSQKTAKAKRTQNTFSFIILLLLILDLFFFYLARTTF